MIKHPTSNNHRSLRFLEWFCPPHLVEGIEGDLVEEYYADAEAFGEAVASRRLWLGVLRFFKPGIIFRNRFRHPFHTIMLRNYLTTTFRNVVKHKVFSAINVIGLGIGITACLLILQFVMYELSYDKFNEKFDRIYRVTNDRFQQGKLIQHGTITYPTIGPAMTADYPEIESYSRLMPAGDLNVKVGDRFFRGESCIFADDHLLTIFTFPMLAGSPADALKGRYRLVLTETTARKYFQFTGDDWSQIMGKHIYWGLDAEPYTVTGICKDVPENSHLQFDALASYETLYTPENHGADDNWTWSDMRHYLLLKPGVDYKALEAKFGGFSDRHFQGDKVSGSVEKFFLQPLSRAHLYSDYEYDIAKVASGKAVWSMLIVAGFILLIAWINYINLTTSRALERAREVGVRKVMGAIRVELMRQFILESVVISLFAFFTAVLLSALIQKPFNDIIGATLSPMKVLSAMSGSTILILAGVMISGILLAGFYPAVVLSSYQPVVVLTGKFTRSGRGGLIRKALVVFQFTASAALIASTLVVSRQLKFMNEAALGIDIANTVVVQSPERTTADSTLIPRFQAYEQELTTVPGVLNATTSNNIPGARLGRAFNVHLASMPESSNVTFSFIGVDYNFLNTYGMKIVAGRNFEATDHNADWEQIRSVIINRRAARLLNLKDDEEAVGQHVNFWERDWTIIGVVPDFHQQGLKREMEPIVMFPVYSTYASTSVKVKKETMKETIAKIETVFKKHFPENSFDYFLLDEYYNTQYRDEDRFAKVVNIFAVLAVVISCLGLIGLSSYTIAQRTKEIGIRKVLGASTPGIVALLSVDFMRITLLASLLALPLAWFAMNLWLESYPYRIAPGWALFVVPVVSILIITAITVSFQIMRTAAVNPAKTLKYE
ncbi:ABC transporter permease [Chryseolinea sp. T2]|uniref:ABC transporter permease n=1 Tax=Chryseolinea sp. T2 TaxID=3129255 RepID=UPI003078296E